MDKKPQRKRNRWHQEQHKLQNTVHEPYSIQSLKDASLRRTYRKVGHQHSKETDVNPFSVNSKFPYAELQATGKDIPRMLTLMRKDPAIIRKCSTQHLTRYRDYREYIQNIKKHLKIHEEDEGRIDRGREVAAESLILPTLADIRKKSAARIRARSKKTE